MATRGHAGHLQTQSLGSGYRSQRRTIGSLIQLCDDALRGSALGILKFGCWVLRSQLRFQGFDLLLAVLDGISHRVGCVVHLQRVAARQSPQRFFQLRYPLLLRFCADVRLLYSSGLRRRLPHYTTQRRALCWATHLAANLLEGMTHLGHQLSIAHHCPESAALGGSLSLLAKPQSRFGTSS